MCVIKIRLLFVLQIGETHASGPLEVAIAPSSKFVWFPEKSVVGGGVMVNQKMRLKKFCKLNDVL